MKFDNLGLALRMALEFYTSVAEGLKLKVRRTFQRLILKFAEFTVEKLVGGRVVGGFLPPRHPE